MSIARWKARGRLPVRHNLTFFRYLFPITVSIGVTLSANFRRKECHRPPTTVGVRKLE